MCLPALLSLNFQDFTKLFFRLFIGVEVDNVIAYFCRLVFRFNGDNAVDFVLVRGILSQNGIDKLFLVAVDINRHNVFEVGL